MRTKNCGRIESSSSCGVRCSLVVTPIIPHTFFRWVHSRWNHHKGRIIATSILTALATTLTNIISRSWVPVPLPAPSLKQSFYRCVFGAVWRVEAPSKPFSTSFYAATPTLAWRLNGKPMATEHLGRPTGMSSYECCSLSYWCGGKLHHGEGVHLYRYIKTYRSVLLWLQLYCACGLVVIRKILIIGVLISQISRHSILKITAHSFVGTRHFRIFNLSRIILNLVDEKQCWPLILIDYTSPGPWGSVIDEICIKTPERIISGTICFFVFSLVVSTVIELKTYSKYTAGSMNAAFFAQFSSSCL